MFPSSLSRTMFTMHLCLCQSKDFAMKCLLFKQDSISLLITFLFKLTNICTSCVHFLFVFVTVVEKSRMTRSLALIITEDDRD